MNNKEKIYTETICFRATPELKEFFFPAQAEDKAKFIRVLTEVCKRLAPGHDVIRDNTTNKQNNDDVIRDEYSVPEHKSTNQDVIRVNHDAIRDRKKNKAVEKSMFEQVMAEQAEEESKHSIDRLFEVEQ